MSNDLANKIRLLRHITDLFELLAEKHGYHTSQLVLSGYSTAQAIDSALIDMKRMSEFHIAHDKTPDRHKYAGFIAKWIGKLRPIRFVTEPPINLNTQHLQWANALFAVVVMNSFLNKTMDDGIAAHLKYWFQYRDERGETLALVAHCCEK